ncbi:MAG: dihydroorotate dehydrogenase (quinone) [Porticoccaceae bacterium]|nr:dihydroorotate dehydrogenase (quinone) [Porticoccaceae bacterium]
MYSLLRRALFALPAETSHELSLDMLGALERLNLLGLAAPAVPSAPVQVMGLTFDNPVGLAAGLDKNGDYFNALGALGFGFVEIGTVTPRPQPGNPKPRLFRLPEQEAIINRMGFNNLGIDHLVDQVRRRRYGGVLGINIGKNAVTPVENAVDDYLIGMAGAYPHADYITVNISSPNTPGLRSLQFGDSLHRLLAPLKQSQESLTRKHGRQVPLAIKIAPDMNDEEIAATAKVLLDEGIDGVIATNTTIGRDGVEQSPLASETGGLSGAPLMAKSTAVIRVLAESLSGRIPIIGVGGITSGDDAAEKIRAGASLVQIYSGFIYRGPALIADAVEAIRAMEN